MYSNQRETSQILFRKNGVDLLILPERIATLPAPGSVVHIRISEGQLVRHFLSGTTFNLYEGIYRFARSFTREENNYARFFQAVDSLSVATAVMPHVLQAQSVIVVSA